MSPPSTPEASTALRLAPVDATDAAAFAEFHRVLTEVDVAEREFAVPVSLADRRAGFDPANREWGAFGVVAWLGGRAAGALSLELPYLDNTAMVETEIAVLPEHRRAGVGTALFEEGLRFAGSAGRRVIYAETTESDGTGADAVVSPGPTFAQDCGMTRRMVELHQVLDLPVADAVLNGSETRAAAAQSAGYRVVGWRDHCPEEYVSAYCALKSAFLDHTPIGELEVEPERWDADRLRDREQRWRRQGRTSYRALALDPDGEPAGFSDLLALAPPSLDVLQGSLLVLPAHRGRGLAAAMKTATLRAVQQHQPERRIVHTYNSLSNAPVLAVNDRLGFRPVERCSQWQRTV